MRAQTKGRTEVGLDVGVHDAPPNIGRLSLHRDLPLPLSIAFFSTGNPLSDQAPGAVASEEVLAPDDSLGSGGRVGDDGLDGVERVSA